jgi:16S rRNA (guanine527-N7)-methyltransferase
LGVEESEARAAIGSLALRYGLDAGQERLLSQLTSLLSSDAHAPTSVRSPREIVDAHLADSLVALELSTLRDGPKVPPIADLGAGAGIPGLVLAIALPDRAVRLVESLARKCAFIDSAIAELGLSNAVSVCSRTEDWSEGRSCHGLVTARAVAAQPVVLEYAAPLLADGGRLVDWRGRRDQEDEAAALAAAAELGLEREDVVRVAPFAEARDRHLHVFRKVAPTPDRFPRRAGMARKRPLGG